MGGIIDERGERERERENKKSGESHERKTKDRESWKRTAKGRQKRRKEEVKKKEGKRKRSRLAHQGGVIRRIYSRCSPFCPRNHHLCALRCSAAHYSFCGRCARELLHLAASRKSNRFVRFCLISVYRGSTYKRELRAKQLLVGWSREDVLAVYQI